MRRIDVEEFSKNVDLYVQLANAGETIDVTEGGVPAARLTPAPESRKLTLAEMIEQGIVTPAESDDRNIGPGMAVDPDLPSTAEMLEEMREDIVR